MIQIMAWWQAIIWSNDGLVYWYIYTYIQPSAIITQANIVRYYMNNYRNWGNMSIRWWIHRWPPYLALTGELWGVFCEYLWENWLRYNVTALYVSLGLSELTSPNLPPSNPSPTAIKISSRGCLSPGSPFLCCKLSINHDYCPLKSTHKRCPLHAPVYL